MKTTTLAIAAAMAAGTLANSTLAQTTWTVCQDGSCDFTAVQDAVDAAADGDTIAIGPGTYTSDDAAVVSIFNKTVHLNGVAGPDSTFIDGQQTRRGIRIASNGPTPVHISGLTIINGLAASPGLGSRGGGIHLYDAASASITKCVFRANVAGYQAPAICVDSGSTLAASDCLFVHNVVGPAPAWAVWQGPVLTVRGQGGGAPCQSGPSQANISRMLFYSNAAPAVGGTGTLEASSVYIASTDPSAQTLSVFWMCDGFPPAVLDGFTLVADTPILHAGVTVPPSSGDAPGFALSNSTVCGEYAGGVNFVGPWTDAGGNVFGPCVPHIGDDTVALFDCNGNGEFDFFETVDGLVPDYNANGIPDTCECIADLTGNGEVNGADISVLLGFWGKVPEPLPAADINQDGNVDGLDLAVLLGGWGPCK